MINKGLKYTVTFTLEPETETILLSFSDFLRTNAQYELIFIYRGIINEAMEGFYRSSYIDNNETVWLGTTQFQPTHARSVFPCFDEPHYKANFSLDFNIPVDYNVQSNMEIIATAVT